MCEMKLIFNPLFLVAGLSLYPIALYLFASFKFLKSKVKIFTRSNNLSTSVLFTMLIQTTVHGVIDIMESSSAVLMTMWIQTTWCY